MKKGNVEESLRVINIILNKSSESDLNWVVIKNKKILEKEKELLDEYRKPSEKFMEYENKRIELCKKYANKDEKGNVLFDDVIDLQGNRNKEFSGLRDNQEFQEKFKLLIDDYKDELEEENKKLNYYENIIKNEEIETPLNKIKTKIPNGIISGKDMEFLLEMIDEDVYTD